MIISEKSMEKMARLHFYFHTIQSGENQLNNHENCWTSKENGSFVRTFMVDDPLTEEPEPT
ncbi:hypothetical protein NC652_009790 [Populus alba x Populus x berolinensis]|nr:hypothetical protein NC652_009790 [Populus alba x Populus x berolinensis]